MSEYSTWGLELMFCLAVKKSKRRHRGCDRGRGEVLTRETQERCRKGWLIATEKDNFLFQPNESRGHFIGQWIP